MMVEGERLCFCWKMGQMPTEGVKLSGKKTSTGQTSGETIFGAEGAIPVMYFIIYFIMYLNKSIIGQSLRQKDRDVI